MSITRKERYSDEKDRVIVGPGTENGSAYGECVVQNTNQDTVKKRNQRNHHGNL